MRRCYVFAFIGLVMSFARTAIGQSPQTRLVAGGGAATDIRGVRSTAYFVSPSITFYPARSSLLTLNGRGTSFTSGEWSAGGGLATVSRHPIVGPLGLNLSGGADLTWTSYEVMFVTLEAIPAAELRFGPVELFGGVRTGTAWISAPDRSLSPVAGPARRTITTSSFGPVLGGGVEVARFGPGEGLHLQYREDRAKVASERVTDRQILARLVAGPANLAANYGRRDARVKTDFGGVQATLSVTPLLAIMAALEAYPSNRLTGAVGGRTVSAGIALRFGGPRTPRPLPKPSGVGAPPPGFTRISIRASGANRVEIAGDWNEWKPEPARRTANGVWYVDLRLQPGQYRYAFRIDGTHWVVPEGVQAVDDGFGGKSAWLTVRAEGRKDARTEDPHHKEGP